MRLLRELVLYHSLSQYDVKELFYKILLSTANPPLWFMRVLIEFVIIYPIIRMILNNEILAGGGIILTVILHLLIGVNVGYSTVQYWMPLYLMGATFGKNYENQFCISKKIKTLISVIVFFILIFLAKESDVIFYFYRLVSPILMWYIFDFFKKFPSPRWWIKCTVFYYGMHILVISPVAKTYKLFLGQNIIALFLAHIIVPAICITLLAVIAMIVRKFIPEIWKIMIGGRS